MENAGSSSQRNPDVDSSFSIPRGGPIFVPDFVTPLTRVSTFESEVFHLLESLKAELGSDSADFDEDISVDELKIYSDEELVSEAMRIAFEDDQMARISSSDQGQNPCTSGVEDDCRVLDLHKSASGASSSGDSSDPSYDGEEDGANFKKKRNGRGKAKARSKYQTGNRKWN